MSSPFSKLFSDKSFIESRFGGDRTSSFSANMERSKLFSAIIFRLSLRPGDRTNSFILPSLRSFRGKSFCAEVSISTGTELADWEMEAFSL
jgi:hypothetical protein